MHLSELLLGVYPRSLYLHASTCMCVQTCDSSLHGGFTLITLKRPSSIYRFPIVRLCGVNPSIMSDDIVGLTVLQWAFDLLVGRKL